MASIKVILRNEVKKDGTSPLAVRITINRKSSYIYLDYSVLPEQWNSVAQRVKKSHPNSTRLNNYIVKKLAEATDKALDLETQKEGVSSKLVRKTIKPAGGSTFFNQAAIYLDDLQKSGKFNRFSADQPRINRFREYLGGKDISFSDITITLLERFKAYLKGTRGISERTAVNHLVVVRSVFSQAIKDNICDPKYYPFGRGKVRIHFPDTSKQGLTISEIAALEAVELRPLENHARNLFLFSFYLAGVRISDALRMKRTDIDDGRLSYVMGKNNKGGSLKLPEKALRILEQYGENGHDLVFPDLAGLLSLEDMNAVQKRIKTRVHDLNEYLREAASRAGIKKTVTFHISRHSFAQQASDKINIQVLQKLYRHSSLLTTAGYQSNFTHKDTDDALEAVIG